MKRIFGTLDPFIEFGDMLGRKEANAGFLYALLDCNFFDEFHFFLANELQCLQFTNMVQELFPAYKKQIKTFLRQDLPTALATTRYYVFHLSDCIKSQAQLARLRNKYSQHLFPITGITHSLSYADYGTSFLAHLWSGTTLRDCIICSSTTGKKVVQSLFQQLRAGYGLTKTNHPEPSLCRIPLAVNIEELKPANLVQKQRARENFALDPKQAVILVFGRLSLYSKMDLLPLLRAMHRLGKKATECTLMLAGWTEDKESYHEAVVALGTSLGLDVRVVTRPDQEQKKELYQAADIFVSIADNPQETFGISIVEAMAFGLPVIASEYDGYRDLVQHNRTGLLIPTLSSKQTTEIDALAPLLFDSDAHLLVAQETIVDVPELAKALEQLLGSPQKRAEFGANGRSLAETYYSWPYVMLKYLELWQKLWTLPAQRANKAHPLEMRYGKTFGHYTTDNFAADMLLRRSAFGQQVYQAQGLPIIYSRISHSVNQELVRKILFVLRQPQSVAKLCQTLQKIDNKLSQQTLYFVLSWALKHDLLERVSQKQK